MKRFLTVAIAVLSCCILTACNASADKARISELESQVQELQGQLQAKENRERESSNTDSPAIINNKTVDDSNQSAKEPSIINLGEKITLDWAEFTLDSVEWVDEIRPSNTSGVYTYYEGKDDETYLVIKGTWKNISGESYDIGDMKSQFVINDKYKYNGSATREDNDGGGFSSFSLDPLKKVNFIIYTSVPDEAKELFEKGKLTFGFDDNMKNTILSQLDELGNVYVLDIEKI